MLGMTTRAQCGSGPPVRVLVVDDEAAIREVVRIRLKTWGFEVVEAADGAQAKAVAKQFEPDIVVSDVVLPDVSGLELVRILKRDNPERPVILITAYGSVDSAVEAMKQGAQDFLTKPLDYTKLKSTLLAAAAEVAMRRSVRRLARDLDRGQGLGLLVGASSSMRALFEQIRVLAETEASAIIIGETGTGKELVARTVHQLSRRQNGPLIAINSAAIPEGLTESEVFGHEKGAFTGAVEARPGCFELADGGTLFLDELGEMPASLQPKLLRVLEDNRVRRLGSSRERRVDVRVIAATNRDPEKAMAEGLLRSDLYYRLSVFTIVAPPLREHASDIPLLAQDAIQSFNRRHETAVEGVSGEVMELLQAYAWPGNVREMRNVLERGTILAKRGWIEIVHLPPYLRTPKGGNSSIILPAGVSAAQAERIVILETLKMAGNNKAKAARRLGLDVKTIRNKLRAYRDGEPRR